MTDNIAIHLCALGDEKLFRHIADEVFDNPTAIKKLTRYLRL
jgi:hypothetical protein